DPTAPTNNKKMNPRILGVAEYQVDLLRGTVEVVDLQVAADGELVVGVITSKNVGANDVKRTKELGKNVKSRYGSLQQLQQQRQRKLLDGKPGMNSEGQPEGWVDFDWLEAAKPLLIRKVKDFDLPNEFLAVMPPPDQELVIPLPALEGNVKYADVKLKKIKET